MLPSYIPTELEALVMGTSLDQISRDGLILAHLLALAIGLGCVVRTDLSMLQRLGRPVTRRDFARLKGAHQTIFLALIGLWLTGAGLFYLKTGGDLNAASPKLIAKLTTVACLSITAVGMSWIGLPMLRRTIGRPLAALGFWHRIGLALFAGLSLAGWSIAMILGAAGTTRAAAAPALIELFALVYLAALAVTITAAALLPKLVRVAQEHAPSPAQEPAETPQLPYFGPVAFPASG